MCPTNRIEYLCRNYITRQHAHVHVHMLQLYFNKLILMTLPSTHMSLYMLSSSLKQGSSSKSSDIQKRNLRTPTERVRESVTAHYL